LLRDIWLYADCGITERYCRIGFSFRQGIKVQKSLLKRNLIFINFAHSGKQRIKLLSLSERGRKALGIDQGRTDRYGGAVHRYWVKQIAEHLKAKGYEVTKEYPLGSGRTIDILARKNNRKIAFEIETGKSDILNNIRKCRDAGISDVTVMTTSAKAEERIKAACLNNNEHINVIRADRLLRRKLFKCKYSNMNTE